MPGIRVWKCETVAAEALQVTLNELETAGYLIFDILPHGRLFVIAACKFSPLEQGG